MRLRGCSRERRCSSNHNGSRRRRNLFVLSRKRYRRIPRICNERVDFVLNAQRKRKLGKIHGEAGCVTSPSDNKGRRSCFSINGKGSCTATFGITDEGDALMLELAKKQKKEIFHLSAGSADGSRALVISTVSNNGGVAKKGRLSMRQQLLPTLLKLIHSTLCVSRIQPLSLSFVSHTHT